MIKTGTFETIQEARKLFFRESIGNRQITVELNEVGWISVEQFKGNGGAWGHKPIYANINLTIDDAKNLINCLTELVQHKEPTDKGE